jgi:hypothetical protein
MTNASTDWNEEEDLSGPLQDWERFCYQLADEWEDEWLGTTMHPVEAP